MKILYTDFSPVAPSVEKDLNAHLDDKKTLLSESDFVRLHVPLFPETTHYLSRDELSLMKSTAILINASPGPVVDERALVKV
jgi:lactate dehydrogenase-like 2-hydroxyacid dehydrogenase